jgi:hypothetical protein
MDEISMKDIMDFLKLDKYLRNPEALNYPFGGLNIVFCGDFSQLNPVGKKDVIYDQSRNALWGMINRVVNLTMTNWRFLKDQQWGNLPQRMQFPINNYLATTGHKLQGITKQYLIVSQLNYSTPNWIYVVLSRVTSLDSLFLLQPIVRIYSPCMSRHEGANTSRGAYLMH